jgi:hypothetical protein
VSVVATLAALVTDLKLDKENAYVAQSSALASSSIWRVPLAGGRATSMAMVADGVDSGGEVTIAEVTLALDATDVFFASGPTVGKLPKIGGAVTRLASGRSGWLSAGVVMADGYIFWTQQPVSDPSDMATELDRVNAEGGMTMPLASGLATAGVTTVTGTSFYWAGADGTLNRIGLHGGAVTILATDASKRPATSIAVDEAFLYWSVSSSCAQPVGSPPCPPRSAKDAAIKRVPIAGGAVTTLATDFAVSGIAVDGEDLYWIDPYVSVNWVPLPGASTSMAPSHRVAADDGAYLGPILDSSYVYWVSATTQASVSSEIKRARKPL